MKTILALIGLCLAVTAAHSMPVSVLNTNQLSPMITIADQCGDNCRSSRSYRYAYRASSGGGYVLVRDPLIQRRPFCPFGSYVACINSGMVCVDLCY
jgi:hypothetical protein